MKRAFGRAPEIIPAVQIKSGILRKNILLPQTGGGDRGELIYGNEQLTLKCLWSPFHREGWKMNAELRNVSGSPFRIARLLLPVKSHIGELLRDFDPSAVSFLRNGYQSWSTSHSYRLPDIPLRPWLGFVSLVSSNLANMPSNIPGVYSSEMYSLIGLLSGGESILVGQSAPFNQFFYILLHLNKGRGERSNLELAFDFGRKLLFPGEKLVLDEMIIMKGDRARLLDLYFSYLQDRMGIRIKTRQVRGWSSWYYYYRGITPEAVYRNVEMISKSRLNIGVVQIDDGYQSRVGDWLTQSPRFRGRMKEMAGAITASGRVPGLWIAPFIAERKSELLRTFPEFLLRNEFGGPILAGINFNWPGKLFYALDATNPLFQEYLREVIRTAVREWGYRYLKLDFLYAACLRGGQFADFTRSRAEALRLGLSIIREEAGRKVFISACGAPLSACIGLVDSMRIGPDTGPFWVRRLAGLFRAGTSNGVRDSIRNTMARHAMHKKLWHNDPDCLMARERDTGLSPHERMSHINAIIVSGGAMVFSDNMPLLEPGALSTAETAAAVSGECFKGTAIVPDLMEKKWPEIIYNTAGYLCVFNMTERKADKWIDLAALPVAPHTAAKVTDVWGKEEFTVNDGLRLLIKDMPAHSSRLLKIGSGGKR